MKRILKIAVLVLLMMGFAPNTKAQLLDIKPWHGYYPEMGGTYPLSFISFTGWPLPVPHVFVRTWPTRYYVEAGALPVTDAGEISGEMKTGLLRIMSKALERGQMKGRMEETQQISIHTGFSQQVSDKLFAARSDELADIYNLVSGFIKLYQKVDRLGSLDNAEKILPIYEKEADRLLTQFLMVNLLQTDHGSKLEVFTQISHQLAKLVGELDYTHAKLHYFNSYNREITGSYSFLSR